MQNWLKSAKIIIHLRSKQSKVLYGVAPCKMPCKFLKASIQVCIVLMCYLDYRGVCLNSTVYSVRLLGIRIVATHPDMICRTYHSCLIRHVDMIELTKQKSLSTWEIQVVYQKGLLAIITEVLDCQSIVESIYMAIIMILWDNCLLLRCNRTMWQE